jgi:PAS domain-containing protein
MYSAGDLRILERVSAQIAPVIESMHLLDRVQSLAVAVETTLDLVAITDLSGVASYINPAGIRMLGLDAETSGVGISLTDFVPDEIVGVLETSGLRQADVMGGWQSEISLTPPEF